MHNEDMTDILLWTVNAGWIHPSLALRLLKANLGPLENRCAIEEFTLRQSIEEKLAAITAHQCRILGISVSIWNHTGILQLLRALPTANRPIIVLGGPEASYLGPDSPILEYADYRIIGEGEHQFRNLCTHLLCTAPSEGAFKSAYHLYTDEDLQKKLTYVESSRGCPYRCSFCLSGMKNEDGATTGVYEFPLDEFFAQMEILIKRGAHRFKFLDRSFNHNIKRACVIMEFFLKQVESRPHDKDKTGMFVHFELVPSRINDELLDVMKKFPADTLRLEIGVQTLNARTKAAVKRTGDIEKELAAISRITNETKAIVHADLIAGLPHEDLSSFANGFDKLYAVHPCEIQLGILKCLPGTSIRADAGSYGIGYSPDPPYEVIQTADITKEGMARIKNFARFWEVIVNRNPFPDLLPTIVCGDSVFDQFMSLSDSLLSRLGRNWGLDRAVLRDAVLGCLHSDYNV
ncbi:hypothetical protein FACS189494_08950 [Spirochaetia bacterium]|nr:hypothetical protein FACS189494_08950 [Spirochaetia bacterium]